LFTRDFVSAMSEVDVRDTRVIGVDSDDADDLIGALSSDTARDILAELHEEEATPSELAERADTTVQNARYHLESLSDAGLVEVDGMRYSEKGREMDVYVPAEPFVVFVGNEEESPGLRDALKRFVGGIGVLAGASLLVEFLFRQYAPFGEAAPTEEPTGFRGGDDFSAEETQDAEARDAADGGGAAMDDGGAMEMEEQAAEAGATLTDRILELPPGVVFFAVGLVVVSVGVAVWYRYRTRNR